MRRRRALALEGVDGDALDVVIAALACECAYDADRERASERLGALERAVVRRAMVASMTRSERALDRAVAAVGGRRRARAGARRFAGVEFTSKGAMNRGLALETVDGGVYYAFSGTQTARDVMSDANAFATRLASGARAHRGFAARAEAVAVDAVYDVKVLGEGKRLIMCGHSLGGATAALATLMFLLRRPEAATRVRCVTFAAPPIGDDGLRRLIADRGWSSVFTHIQMPEDRIPSILLSRGPGYVHFVDPKLLLDDGRVVARASLDDEEDEALMRAQKDSAGLVTQPRSAVYAHAMKTYRERLMLSLRLAVPTFDADAFSDELPRAVPIRTHLGPAPKLERAVGVLTRDGTHALVLVRGSNIDARTCWNASAEAKGWACSATSTVVSSDALLIDVTAPVLHGAPLPSATVCSPSNHASWMPLVVGAGGDFSTARVNVQVVPRTILVIRDDASWTEERKMTLMKKQTGWNIEEVGPIEPNLFEGFIATARGCVIVHRATSGGVLVRRGGSTDSAEAVGIPEVDAKALDKAVRAALAATEKEALAVTMVRFTRSRL